MIGRKAAVATATATGLIAVTLLAAFIAPHRTGNSAGTARTNDVAATATTPQIVDKRQKQGDRFVVAKGKSFEEKLREPATGRQPHIVYVLVDDLGWANVGFNRKDLSPAEQAEFRTPTITSLAEQGVILERHYVYPVCSPTRSSLLSGRLPVHVNLENNGFERNNPADPVSGSPGIPRNMTTIASKLKAAGYATHMLGKWAVGYSSLDHTPLGRGFDSSLNYFHNANDMWNQDQDDEESIDITVKDLWNTVRPATRLAGTKYEEALYLDRITSILQAHDAATPLFIFYASRIAHTPLQAPQEYLDRFAFINDSDSRRAYAAMVSYLDDNIASLVDQLKSKGLWDNTLLIFSADNGGPVRQAFSGGNNYPLCSGKGTFLEGGVRVASFVSGGFVPQARRGTREKGYLHVADWYATLCAVAGVDPEDTLAAKAGLPPIDSINMWPLLSGAVTESPRTETHLDLRALISGDYKVVTGTWHYNWQGPFYPNASTPDYLTGAISCATKGCLFNIREDPTEHVNLANAMPEKLQEMLLRLAELNQTYFNPQRGRVDPAARQQAVANGGFWGPWL